jgi:argininosuccinate synthase
MEIYACWKEDDFLSRFGDGGRRVMRAYLEEQGVPVPSGGSDRPDPYSQDENLLHISSEGVALEKPEESHLGRVIYSRLTDPMQAPDSAEFVRVHFEHGVPVRVAVEDEQGREKQSTAGDLLTVFTAANEVAGRHGIGLLDMVEHRYVGIKSRGVYEAPGHTLLMEAHIDLESLVHDGPLIDQKCAQAPLVARLMYNGGWFSQEMRRYLSVLPAEQERVTGWSLLRLYKGSMLPVARWSPHSLYDRTIASFDDMTGRGYDPRKARGFIDVQALHMYVTERARHQRT